MNSLIRDQAEITFGGLVESATQVLSELRSVPLPPDTADVATLRKAIVAAFALLEEARKLELQTASSDIPSEPDPAVETRRVIQQTDADLALSRRV